MDEVKEKVYRVFESKGQLKITLNRTLAQAHGIQKGTKIKWMAEHGDLVIRKVE